MALTAHPSWMRLGIAASSRRSSAAQTKSPASRFRFGWVVERIFGWMTSWKRPVRDNDQRLDVSEAMIHVAL